MDRYYGVIYFKDGHKVETGNRSDERACERETYQLFERYMKTAISPHFEPSRYEVKKR